MLVSAFVAGLATPCVAQDKTSDGPSAPVTSGGGGSIVAPQIKQVRWIDTDVFSDWRGQDRASSAGLAPINQIGNFKLCDSNHVGFVAVCWSDRTGGYPSGVPSDLDGRPAAWCTYKKGSIQVSTAQTGGAPGRVFVCR